MEGKLVGSRFFLPKLVKKLKRKHGCQPKTNFAPLYCVSPFCLCVEELELCFYFYFFQQTVAFDF